MNRKAIVHLCIFTALACLTVIVWLQTAEKPVPPASDGEVEMVENIYGDLVPADGGTASGVGASGGVLIRGFMFLIIGIYAAGMFLAYVLPNLVNRAAREMYGSGAEVEDDPLHDARALVAQGDYFGAIEAYRAVAEATPDDRLPWVEIARIQNDHLDDPDAAIETLRHGLESREWSVNNAAFFMFRIAELCEKERGDVLTAVQLLQQVVELFPETRHAANATHRLRDLGAF